MGNLAKPTEYYLHAAIEEGNYPPILKRWANAVNVLGRKAMDDTLGNGEVYKEGSVRELLDCYDKEATLKGAFADGEVHGRTSIRECFLQNAGRFRHVEFTEIKATPTSQRCHNYQGECVFTAENGEKQQASFVIETSPSTHDNEIIAHHELWPHDGEEGTAFWQNADSGGPLQPAYV